LKEIFSLPGEAMAAFVPSATSANFTGLAAARHEVLRRVGWNVEEQLQDMPPRIQLELEGKAVSLRCWRKTIEGVLGATIPVFFLDADLPENAEEQRRLTDFLYGGDPRYRLCQEAILGIGGLRMLHALGYEGLETYHMNEGHSSFLTLELMGEMARRAGRGAPSIDDVTRVKNHCVFTSHTPVSAGHDRFPKSLVKEILAPELFDVFRYFLLDAIGDGAAIQDPGGQKMSPFQPRAKTPSRKEERRSYLAFFASLRETSKKS